MDGNYIGKGDDGGLIKTYADGSCPFFSGKKLPRPDSHRRSESANKKRPSGPL
ncbi:hypothetical protein IJG93_04055 [Candidatus Saccharibacteria bacterium]|nr:hypothetical protein [Candidatus Saccharibacteria bacterium]